MPFKKRKTPGSMAGSGTGSPRKRGTRTRNPHPNQNGGWGAPTCQEKVALGHKVRPLSVAESDFHPPKWPSVLSRASRKVVIPPGVLVRQNTHHHYKDLAGQHTPAGARAVLLEHYGMDGVQDSPPAPVTTTQTTSPQARAATATPATPATPAPNPAGQSTCSPLTRVSLPLGPLGPTPAVSPVRPTHEPLSAACPQKSTPLRRRRARVALCASGMPQVSGARTRRDRMWHTSPIPGVWRAFRHSRGARWLPACTEEGHISAARW